jgi:hypothetical protein
VAGIPNCVPVVGDDDCGPRAGLSIHDRQGLGCAGRLVEHPDRLTAILAAHDPFGAAVCAIVAPAVETGYP